MKTLEYTYEIKKNNSYPHQKIVQTRTEMNN